MIRLIILSIFISIHRNQEADLRRQQTVPNIISLYFFPYILIRHLMLLVIIVSTEFSKISESGTGIL